MKSLGKFFAGVLIGLGILFLIGSICMCFTSCSSEMIEGSKPSNASPENLYAVFEMADGELIEGKVESYDRYSEACIRLEIDDISYFVHPVNVTLICKEVTE